MKGSSFFKKLVYFSLWGGISFQLLILSLLWARVGEWASPVLFNLSQYYLRSLDCHLLSGHFHVENGKTLSLTDAVAYIGKDKTAVLSLKEALFTFRDLKVFWPSLDAFDVHLDGLSLGRRLGEKSLLAMPHLSLSLEKGSCKIEEGYLTYGTLNLGLGGSVKLKNLSLFTQQAKPNFARVEAALVQAERFQERMAACQEPMGSVYFQEKVEGTAIHVFLGAATPKEGLFQGVVEAFPSRPLRAAFRCSLPSFHFCLKDGTSIDLKNILGALTTPALEDAKELQASVSVSGLNLQEWPSISFLKVDLRDAEWPCLRLGLSNVEGGSWARAKVNWELEQKKVWFMGKGAVQNTSLQHPFLKRYMGEGSYLKDPLFFDLQGNFEADYAFKQLRGTVQATHLRLLGITLESLRADLALTPTSFALSQVYFQHPECQGEGMYYQNLDTSDYRFLLKGSLNPHLITPVMDPWWKDLWAGFHLHQAWPDADVDVEGNWDKQSTTFVYGYATAKDFSFRKAALDGCSLYFWAAPLYLQLFDLSLEYQNQKANTLMDWVYSPEDPDNYYAIAFEAKSSLSLNHLALLLASKDVEELSHAFQCTLPPSLVGRGILYGISASPRQDHLRLQCEVSQALSYEGIGLGYLSFQAHKRGPKTDVSSLNFGLAGGRAWGSLALNSLSPSPELSFDLTLDDADYEALRELVRYKDQFKTSADVLSPPGGSPPALSFKKAEEAAFVGGLASLKAKGRGQLGVFNSFAVEGMFGLKDAQLGQIHLLGQLSKILKLGSFDFKDLKADFQLDAGLLTVPSLSIWGNTARMEGRGDYSLIWDELDFSLHFYLLGGLNLPVVSHIFRWIDPLSKLSFIQLKGSLDEPEWKLKLSPFAFLK